MKPYSQWVAEQAGTIEDRSTFSRSIPTQSSANVDLSTGLKIRRAMADLVVTKCVTVEDVVNWVGVFCHNGQINYRVSRADMLDKLLPKECCEKYYECHNAEENLAWLEDVRKYIDNN